MPAGQRPLPTHPSLRYLKLAAKRRLAAGEFPSLHAAQQAIADEYGQPSWAALKDFISGRPPVRSEALPHLDWVIARFADAAGPTWAPPGEEELRQHFSEQVLAAVPAGELARQLARGVAELREKPVVVDQEPLAVRARVPGAEVIAVSEETPPHRLTGLNVIPLAGRVTDPRAAAPSARALGDVPAGVVAIADDAYATLGPAGLVIAGGDAGRPAWAVARGWANLERSAPLDADCPLPASGLAALVTATAVLRLAADGQVGLDQPVNELLRAVRLAEPSITVRELLSHSSGIDDVPANPAELFGPRVREVAAVVGQVVACGGRRGVVRPTNSGCAVLGQLIADVTGLPYAAAATSLVLRPLGMSESAFPASAADIGPGAMTGYGVTAAGAFEPAPATVCTLQAAGGLWATAADLVRLGTGWSSLLPAELAREAVTPQAAAEADGVRAGLGWLIRPRGDTALLGGIGPDGVATLTIRLRDNRTHLIAASRLVPLDAVDDQLLRTWTNPSSRVDPTQPGTR
jgi:CubicO group peptidase (beta-lactamase class C family)